MKHMIHISNIGDIPPSNRLVEGKCAPKHAHHFSYLGYIPCSNRVVEGPCVIKHAVHNNYIGYIPLPNRLVEGPCVIKHICHIIYIGYIPTTYVIVEIFFICEETTHISDTGNVPVTDTTILFFSFNTISRPKIYGWSNICISSVYIWRRLISGCYRWRNNLRCWCIYYGWVLKLCRFICIRNRTIGKYVIISINFGDIPRPKRLVEANA